jgi:nicotinamide riboside transporter PnuC
MLKKIWSALSRAVTRNPVVISGGFAALLQFVSTQIVPLTVDQQGTLNAAVVALLGFIAAAAVSEEKAVPAIAGLVQAVLAVVLAFDVHMSTQWQTAVMAFVTTGVAMFVHTQVTARGGPPRGRHEVNWMRG